MSALFFSVALGKTGDKLEKRLLHQCVRLLGLVVQVLAGTLGTSRGTLRSI